MGNFFTSSIGKKVMMSLAGLFLCSFLLVHLGINLLLLLNDGGAAYAVAVHFMTTNILIKIMEIFLFGGILLHMVYGVILYVQNILARGTVRYKKANHSQTSFFSKYMVHTGVIIFTFLVLHFFNFYFVKLGWVKVPEGALDKHDFYTMVINLFQQPLYSVMYIGFMIFLGFHLHHALQSGFQTLGLNHSKYMPIIKGAGLVYSIIIALGFSIIPLYFLIFYKA